MIATKHGTAKLGKLKADVDNPRRINDDELERLVTSIVKFGFVQPVVARDGDLLVAGGHQRVAALKVALEREGKTKKQIAAYDVPAVLLDRKTPDATMKALNLALNKIGGEWDYEKLSEIFAGWPDEADDLLAATGFTEAEVRDIETLMSEDNPFAGTAGGGDDAEEAHRLVVKFANKAELDEAAEALRARGMTGPSNAGAALLALVRQGATT